MILLLGVGLGALVYGSFYLDVLLGACVSGAIAALVVETIVWEIRKK